MPLPAIVAAAGRTLLSTGIKGMAARAGVSAVLRGGNKGEGGSAKGGPSLSRSQTNSIGQNPQGQKNLPFGI